MEPDKAVEVIFAFIATFGIAYAWGKADGYNLDLKKGADLTYNNLQTLVDNKKSLSGTGIDHLLIEAKIAAAENKVLQSLYRCF